jgi:hypothetical protein
MHAYKMKYRTSEQELSISHSSQSAPILSKLPQVPCTGSRHSISPSAYNYISHRHTVRTTNQLTLHPLHGAMRRHKQKDVSAMMHNEEAATETGSLPASQSLYPTRDL